MENIKDYLDIAQFVIMIGGVVFGIFFYFSKPDQRASKRLDKIETTCPIKHNRIDEIFSGIQKSIDGINATFDFFQRNDFKHIDDNTRLISERITRMEGQMDTIIVLMKDVLNRK